MDIIDEISSALREIRERIRNAPNPQQARYDYQRRWRELCQRGDT